MRIDLNELQPGAWAEILDSVPHKVMRAVRSIAQSENKPSDQEQDLADKVVLGTMVSAWNVKDAAAKDVPLPSTATVEQMDMVDEFVLGRIFKHIVDLIKKRGSLDPNSENVS